MGEHKFPGLSGQRSAYTPYPRKAGNPATGGRAIQTEGVIPESATKREVRLAKELARHLPTRRQSEHRPHCHANRKGEAR